MAYFYEETNVLVKKSAIATSLSLCKSFVSYSTSFAFILSTENIKIIMPAW